MTEDAVAGMPMDSREFLIDRFSGTVDLGLCLAGRDLNLLVFRGSAPLDVLAAISAADTYDYYENPLGTQRALKPKHAKDCYEYAIGSLDVDSTSDPRFFPEVLLNVRDVAVLEMTDPESPGELLEIDSTADGQEYEGRLLRARVALDRLQVPKPKYQPQISRVDGNHRLFQTDRVLDDLRLGNVEEGEFPSVPFSLLVGVNPESEAVLFRDVNGRPEKMDTTHLENLEGRIIPEETLKKVDLPRWVSRKLVEEGRAFHRMVFMGGSTEGAKREGGGKMPPIKLNSLKGFIKTQLDKAPTVMATLKDDDPDTILQLVDNYWKAVAEVFPEAWSDRNRYILLQAIGMNAFAQLGGKFMEEALAVQQGKVEHFVAKLGPLSGSVDLAKSNPSWSGLGGLAGGARVYEALLGAYDENKANARLLRESLFGSDSLDDILGTPGQL